MAPKGKAEPAKGKAEPAKGKAEPAKAEAKAGEKEEPKKPSDYKITYLVCGVISLLSIAIMVVIFSKIQELHEQNRPTDTAFKQLRSSLAIAVNDKEFLKNEPKEVADEVHLLPMKIDKSIRLYEEKKKQYRTLFDMGPKSSSGPWKLHGRSLYYFSKQRKTWYDAENFCISRDAHLTSVLNKEEQNFISSKLEKTSWIGLTLEDEEGKWRWSDGSTLVKQYWSEGQPRKAKVFGKSNQDCAMMEPSLKVLNWKENSCHKHYRWVCKENLDLGKR